MTINRTTTQGITTNYVSLIVPTDGLNNLMIDGVNANTLTTKYIATHPRVLFLNLTNTVNHFIEF